MRTSRIGPTSRRRFLRHLLAVAASFALAATWSVTAGAAAEAAIVTVCVVNPGKPHGSRHVGGTMNAVGTVERCVGKPVPDLHLDVQLQRLRGGAWRVVPTKKKVLAARGSLIRIGRSRTCVPGTYRTRLRVFHFGRHGVWHYSGPTRVACGLASGGGAGGGGGGW
nr:hypothetical protein [Propionicimonas sp.]